MRRPQRVALRYHPTRNPLMRKGGAHQKAKSAVRRETRNILDDELEEYLQLKDQEADQDDPPFLSLCLNYVC